MLQSQILSCGVWTCCSREHSSIRVGSTQFQPLGHSDVCGHREWSSSGSGALSLQWWTCSWLLPPFLSTAVAPTNPTIPDMTEAPATLAPPSPSPSSHGSRACNTRDLGSGRRACHPCAPGRDATDTSSRKVPMTPEAQAGTTRAPGNTSERGGRGWKVPTLKYNQG